MTIQTQNSKKTLIIIAVLLFILVIAIYSLTLPNINPNYADSDEFITAAKAWGVAHPPGYPLYVMLAGIIGRLPIWWLTFAGRVNLLSAILHAGTVVMVFLSSYLLISRALKHYLIAVLSSLIGSLTLAFSHAFWFNGIVAEVFPLNNFLISLLTLLLIIWANKKTNSLLLLSSFIFGLTLSNQQASVVLLPMIVYWVLIHNLKIVINWKFLIKAMLILSLGFILPYLYVPLASFHQPYINWENVHNLASLKRLIIRQAYADVSPSGSAYINFGRFNQELLSEGIPYYLNYLFGGINAVNIFLTIGAVYFFTKARSFRLLNFILLGIFGGGLFFAIYQPIDFSLIGKDDYTMAVLIGQRFYLLSLVYFSLMLSGGVAGLLIFLRQKYPHAKNASAILVGLLIILIGLKIILGYQDIKGIDFTIYNRYGKQIMKTLKPNAILLSYTLERGGFLSYYLQTVENVRPDVIVVSGDFNSRSRDYLVKKYPGLLKTVSLDPVVRARDLIRWQINKRPIYLLSVNTRPFYISQINVDGKPYYLTPVGCGLLQVTKEFTPGLVADPCLKVEEEIRQTYQAEKNLYNDVAAAFFASNHFNYGNIYAYWQCSKQAQLEYLTAVEIYPPFRAARETLQATLSLKDACPSHLPLTSMEHILVTAEEYQSKGDLNNAVYTYYQGMMLEPGRIDLRLTVADLFVKLKAFTFAKTEYQDILTLDPNNKKAIEALKKISILK